MEVCGKFLLHAYRRASSAYVACDSKQVFHRNHLDFLVARNLCEGLQVHFSVSGNDAYDVAAPVPVEHECLENTFYGLAEAFRHMLCCQVVFVEVVWNQIIFYSCLVKQSGRIGLFCLLCHFHSI